MKAINTNVLLRVLGDDPSNQKQCDKARDLALSVECFFVAQILQVELVWVLKTAYQFSKADIIYVLDSLIKNSAFELQRPRIYVEALNNFRENNVDFSDCIIFAESAEKEALPLVTFDKKLSKIKNTQLL